MRGSTCVTASATFVGYPRWVDLVTSRWNVVEEVAMEVTDEGGKVHKVVVDSITVKDEMVLTTEVEDGFFSKLSSNRIEMFKTALGERRFFTVATQKARGLDLKAAVKLFEQSTKLNLTCR